MTRGLEDRTDVEDALGEGDATRDATFVVLPRAVAVTEGQLETVRGAVPLAQADSEGVCETNPDAVNDAVPKDEAERDDVEERLLVPPPDAVRRLLDVGLVDSVGEVRGDIDPLIDCVIESVGEESAKLTKADAVTESQNVDVTAADGDVEADRVAIEGVILAVALTDAESVNVAVATWDAVGDTVTERQAVTEGVVEAVARGVTLNEATLDGATVAVAAAVVETVRVPDPVADESAVGDVEALLVMQLVDVGVAEKDTGAVAVNDATFDGPDDTVVDALKETEFEGAADNDTVALAEVGAVAPAVDVSVTLNDGGFVSIADDDAVTEVENTPVPLAVTDTLTLPVGMTTLTVADCAGDDDEEAERKGALRVPEGETLSESDPGTVTDVSGDPVKPVTVATLVTRGDAEVDSDGIKLIVAHEDALADGVSDTVAACDAVAFAVNDGTLVMVTALCDAEREGTDALAGALCDADNEARAAVVMEGEPVVERDVRALADAKSVGRTNVAEPESVCST